MFFFEAANITNQILNFGLPAPIDVQVVGRNAAANYRDRAADHASRIAQIPGAADVHIHQVMDYPEIELERGPQQGGPGGPHAARREQQPADLAQRQRPDRAHAVAGLAQRRQLPRRRADAAVPHQFAGRADADTRSALQRLDDLEDGDLAGGLGERRATRSSARPEPGVAGLRQSGRGGRRAAAALQPGRASIAASRREIVNHYNVQPVFDVYANVDRRDLGSVGSAVEKIIARDRRPSCRGAPRIDLRGQIATMQNSFYRLGLGMIFAVVLVYLLMAVNFQSWLDPFIILMALPGALAGIVWMLFITQTTFSVPSLMGAIMCIGVATANSILLVVFANDQREEGMDARVGGALRRAHAHPAGADDGAAR